ncbi:MULTISPECIES: 3'-5' exonuclease [unclassified Halomonas]|uniref:3'-5' exonuclease n=1 Tax=unclassified Halomonas TaxID=2609666 RepID=UPI0031F55CE5|tara:strand:+ start:2624 stop:3316 length:693 start_codon:yes stop_codon:yes gene_type:complete
MSVEAAPQGKLPWRQWFRLGEYPMLRAIRRVADRRRQADGDFAWLFNPYTGDELVSLDCETTGLDTRHAELVSIAAVRIRDDRVLTSESLDLRLARPASLSGDSICIHRLRGVDLEGGLEVREALTTLLEFIGNRPLVGWCIDFDLAMLDRYLKAEFGFSLPNATIDVAQQYRKRLRRSHPEIEVQPTFEQLAERLGVPIMGRHTALGDAVTTALMHLRLESGALTASSR